MSRYILRNNFQKLAESAGTVVNISTVKVELSEQAVAGTGVILYPRRKISFGSPIFAAKAAGESGAAVIGVIQGKATSGNSDGSTFYDGDDEVVTDEEIKALFNGSYHVEPADNQDGGTTDSAGTTSDDSQAAETNPVKPVPTDGGTADSGAAGNQPAQAIDDEFITDEELRRLFYKN